MDFRDPRVTSAIIGVSSVSQVEDNLGALNNSQFSASELEEIDRAVGARVVTRAHWAGSGEKPDRSHP